MSNYVPIRVEIVALRCQGKPIPEHIKLAERFPCVECGAPAGMACTGESALCWRGRLLTDEQWKMAKRARKAGSGAPGGFRDEIYTGLHHLGVGYNSGLDDGLAMRIRWMGDAWKIVQAVLDSDLKPR